ncbi:MAG: hypothetical protein WBG37_05505 [Desulfobacterales bacterium]|jgi:hypothetical protein
MSPPQEPVAQLKKMYLELSLAADLDQLGSAQAVPQRLNFISGVGSSGLTPLEFKLAEMRPGDSLRLRLAPSQWQSFFGHLSIAWPEAMAHSPQRCLQIKLLSIEQPTQREIIQALADVAACGSGCCGNH